MLTVSQLFVYPIKSLGGVAVSSASVTDRGFQHDRRWMLVDDNNTFLTQRTFGILALLKVEFSANGLSIRHSPTNDLLHIPFIPECTETGIAQIWDDQCEVQFVSPQADDWFTTKLGKVCRLVYMPEHSHRSIDRDYSIKHELTSLADEFPFLMIGQSSLDDLNSRLQQPVPINRFRPNIVFAGGAPYQEDDMHRFTINNILFHGVKPCGRCTLTTIDQLTAVKGKEPLHTLATYRRVNNKINFGQNLVAQGFGEVHVGDSIFIS